MKKNDFKAYMAHTNGMRRLAGLSLLTESAAMESFLKLLDEDVSTDKDEVKTDEQTPVETDVKDSDENQDDEASTDDQDETEEVPAPEVDDEEYMSGIEEVAKKLATKFKSDDEDKLVSKLVTFYKAAYMDGRDSITKAK